MIDESIRKPAAESNAQLELPYAKVYTLWLAAWRLSSMMGGAFYLKLFSVWLHPESHVQSHVE